MMEERRRFFSDLKELKLKGEFINFGHNHDIGLKGGHLPFWHLTFQTPYSVEY